MQADVLTMQADVLTMQADALTMQADALTMQADVLTMQGMPFLNSVRIKERLYLVDVSYRLLVLRSHSI
ncbi:hypothetical protein [Nostoc sp.]|uniref:hypothetical protein n=1 Tax=Nostoc sp. TaxID=1180 RepID=UPI002FFA319C